MCSVCESKSVRDRSSPLVKHVNAIGNGKARRFELVDRGDNRPIGNSSQGAAPGADNAVQCWLSWHLLIECQPYDNPWAMRTTSH
jgi:hypothetical protein